MTIQDYLRNEAVVLLDFIPKWRMTERAAQWRVDNSTGAKKTENLIELMELHYKVQYALERLEFINRLLREFPE